MILNLAKEIVILFLIQSEAADERQLLQHVIDQNIRPRLKCTIVKRDTGEPVKLLEGGFVRLCLGFRRLQVKRLLGHSGGVTFMLIERIAPGTDRLWIPHVANFESIAAKLTVSK